MKKIFLLLFLIGGTVQADLAADRAQADAHLEANNFKKAFKAYHSLAKDGDHHAQYQLAQLFESGKGVKEDDVDAYAWSALAAESNLDKLVAYSEGLLEGVSNKRRAKAEAEKLRDKYGKDALREKADRIASRENGRRSGSCTGSRLSCRNVKAYKKTHENAGPPPVDPAGGG